MHAGRPATVSTFDNQGCVHGGVSAVAVEGWQLSRPAALWYGIGSRFQSAAAPHLGEADYSIVWAVRVEVVYDVGPSFIHARVLPGQAVLILPLATHVSSITSGTYSERRLFKVVLLR